MRYTLILLLLSFSIKAQKSYFPGKIWMEKSPESQGLDSKKF